MYLANDFVQMWKFSEDQKKMQMDYFFSPNLSEDQKKKVFIKTRTLFLPEFRWRPKKKVFSRYRTIFSPNLRSDVHPLKLLGGKQMWTILKLLGGYSQIIGGDISPHLTGFRHPCLQVKVNLHRILFLPFFYVFASWKSIRFFIRIFISPYPR